MRHPLIAALLFFTCFTFFAQTDYQIDNETLTLETEVEGKLDLLWNVSDKKFRYFIKTESGDIVELLNTRGEDKRYQEQYKTVLKSLTSAPMKKVDKVNLTLFDLREFLNDYNKSVDPNFNAKERTKLGTSLALFGGMTNHPFVENPTDETTAFFGAEIELFNKKKLPRHSIFFNLRYEPDTNEFKHQLTQLSLGYKFKFLNFNGFDMYANLKAATFNFARITQIDENGMEFTESSSGLDAPFILGLGADIRLFKKISLILDYHHIYAVLIDNYADFPMDFAAGLKMEF